VTHLENISSSDLDLERRLDQGDIASKAAEAPRDMCREVDTDAARMPQLRSAIARPMTK
jgi:hypothetical protein